MSAEAVDDQSPARRRRVRRRVVFLAVLVVLAALCGAPFLPKVANRFGYALPGDRGLPYKIHYNGRDYRSGATCAGARWCEDEKTPEQRARPYCKPRAELRPGSGDSDPGLVRVDEVFTLFGPSHPVFTVGVAPAGTTFTTIVVEASTDCYLTYALMGGP
ncbi:hypothetical protein ACIQUM_31885 [Amycolatopsis azurea]|uniref:hypothetical protein n=1 Tax=Amycolatopsis azurea TaxID=36819 RepID=UPI003821EED4